MSPANGFASPQMLSLWSGQGESPTDSCGQGALHVHARSIAPLCPWLTAAPRAQLPLAPGDSSPGLAGATQHLNLSGQDPSQPQDSVSIAAGASGGSKRVGVPSLLLLLTPAGDIGDRGTSDSGGHKSRCPSSEHGCCGATRFLRQLHRQLACRGLCPVRGEGTVRPCTQTSPSCTARRALGCSWDKLVASSQRAGSGVGSG